MAKKFDPKTLNGVHFLVNDNGKRDTLTAQWYDGVESYYIIINNDPAMQGSMTVAGLKRLLKKYEVKQEAAAA